VPRIVDVQTNPWARAQGPEPQRSDLWIVDFQQVVSGLKTVTGLNRLLPTSTLATYYARSVALPDLKTRAESFRRDSRPYQFPSWDEPLDAIRITFLLDCYKGGTIVSPYQSDIYNILDYWRAVVRAGRGPMSNEYALRLDPTYRIDYAFNLSLKLLRPGMPTVNGIAANDMVPIAKQDAVETQAAASLANKLFGGSAGVPGPAGLPPQGRFPTPVPPPSGSSIENDLQEALALNLVNCWLATFKVGELNYDQARTVPIDATFYADNIEQEGSALGPWQMAPVGPQAWQASPVILA
jgi:hypothetical protein